MEDMMSATEVSEGIIVEENEADEGEESIDNNADR